MPRFLAIACAVVAAGCSDVPTETRVPNFGRAGQYLTLSYVCGNTFRVRNTSDTTISATWEVFKMGESGSLSLPPKPADQPYSETFFTTVKTGTVRFFSGGQHIKNEANGNKACATNPRLRIVLGPGAAGSPASPDTTYASGAAVAYVFSAAPGYQNVSALLDTILVPASGTITMNGDHVVLVSADTVVTINPADQPIFDGLRALLTAADPVAAYQEHLARVDALYRSVGIEEASRRLNVVEYLAIDPARDEAALRRIDAALANHVFDLPTQAAPNGSLRQGRPTAASVQNPYGPSDSVTFFFVNGIFNDDQSATDSRVALRSIIVTLGGQLPNVNVRHFYNRTYTDQGGGPDERAARCLVGAPRG